MRNEQIEQNQAAVNLFGDDSAFTLTDAELLAIHGGTSPGGGGSEAGSYGPAEFRQDLATVGSAASIGNMAVPGGTGALVGGSFGLGVVAEHRFGVVDGVTNVVSSFVDNVLANEETHRSNII